LRLQPRPSPRCAARASPVRRHHRAPTVRAANRRSEPGHARTPCAFRHSSSCLGCGCTPFGRAPSTRALLGPACKETWDHLRATFALAPFAGRGATMATVVATDATREQSAVDGGASPSAVPTVDSSDAGAPSAAVSNRAVELTAVSSTLAHLRCHWLSSLPTHTPQLLLPTFSLDRWSRLQVSTPRRRWRRNSRPSQCCFSITCRSHPSQAAAWMRRQAGLWWAARRRPR